MKLRGHHLICLQFFRGEGYSPAFVDNLSTIVGRAEAGETVVVVSGPDEVCRACPHLFHDQCRHGKTGERGIRELDHKACFLLSVRPGDRRSWQEVSKVIRAAAPSFFSSFCADCGWLKICSQVRNSAPY